MRGTGIVVITTVTWVQILILPSSLYILLVFENCKRNTNVQWRLLFFRGGCVCVVQALMVLSLVREYHNTDCLGDIVSAQDIVHVANNIFLSDQVC